MSSTFHHNCWTTQVSLEPYPETYLPKSLSDSEQLSTVTLVAAGLPQVFVMQHLSLSCLHLLLQVLEEVLGQETLYYKEGGTIPAMALLKKQLGIDMTMFSFGLPDDNIHAPNERWVLSTLPFVLLRHVCNTMYTSRQSPCCSRLRETMH